MIYCDIFLCWYFFRRLKRLGLLVGVGGFLQATIIITAVLIGVYDLPVSMAGGIEGGA
jgi:hypothetical protein